MTELLCFNLFFYFKDTATTEIYTYGHTLSLHDALPILIGLAVDAGEEHAHGRAHRLPDGGGRAHDDGGAQPEPAQQPAPIQMIIHGPSPLSCGERRRPFPATPTAAGCGRQGICCARPVRNRVTRA